MTRLCVLVLFILSAGVLGIPAVYGLLKILLPATSVMFPWKLWGIDMTLLVLLFGLMLLPEYLSKTRYHSR